MIGNVVTDEHTMNRLLNFQTDHIHFVTMTTTRAPDYLTQQRGSGDWAGF